MRHTAFSLLTLLFAFTAVAQLQPGTIAHRGDPFPIVADFDGDGLDDLIQDDIVLLNDGGALVREHHLGLPAGEKVVGVLDVNADGRLDLIAQSAATPQYPAYVQPQPQREGPSYLLYIANPARRYAAPVYLSKGDHPYVADADGDGRDDVLVFAEVRPDGRVAIATDVTVLRSRGDGTFERLDPIRIPTGSQIYPDHRVLAGDLDHDGRPELVIRGVEDLLILHGTGGGTFTLERRYVPQVPEFGTHSCRLADIDGDSHLDIILPGHRSIRVLFGDGRGGFPRMTRAAIAKLHDAVLPSDLPPIDVDQFNQPRNLAVGHFTARDRMQIAAGTGEGDLVVFAYERGALREVSRTFTEFWMLDIRPGVFRRTGGHDVYVTGTLIWGDRWPKPRLFGAETVAATSAPARASSRTRAANRTLHDTTLSVHFQGDCVDARSERWLFARDGVFGLAHREETRIEAIFDASTVYLRIHAPFAREPIRAALTETNGVYSGTVDVLTECGWRSVGVTAVAE
ncbi:MAG TPA: VCBS repeat-containing protein [Thermoanaerobaculia bacterium]|nr:VCBS repeat-containing protein [Thermoanaerobaculia bacterium]